jgi:hypothetical protein
MKESKTILTIVFLMILVACNKEDPFPVSAKFTTSIQNNTLTPGERFTVYTSETTGEFLTYFKGDKEGTSYPDGFGTTLEVGADSISLSGYSSEGSYTFTLVATSYGNWGETVDQDVQSIDITVTSTE